MKKKIAVINNYERLSPRVWNEVISLSEKGFSIEVYNWVRKKEDIGQPDVLDQESIKVHNIWLGAPKGNLKIIFYLPIFYYKLLNKIKNCHFDAIHCTHIFLLPLVLLVKKIKKAKVVHDAYEMYSTDFGEYIPRLSKYLLKLTELIENHMVSKVDLILTIDSRGGFLEKRYSKFNQNVSVLYNVPKLNFEYNDFLLNQIKKKYEARKIIVNIGKIRKEKGLLKCLEVTKKIKGFYQEILLLLIGDLMIEKEELEEYLRKNKLEKNVEFKNWLPYGEMMHYLKCADVALALYQPTLRHYHLVSRGNSRKFFTFMQAGLPIVAPNFGEIAKVVEEEDCGILVDSTDCQQITEAVLYLFDHLDEARRLGENGSKAIRQKYNWESEERKLLTAYWSMFEDGEFFKNRNATNSFQS